jgi:hypothetical protein
MWHGLRRGRLGTLREAGFEQGPACAVSTLDGRIFPRINALSGLPARITPAQARVSTLVERDKLKDAAGAGGHAGQVN